MGIESVLQLLDVGGALMVRRLDAVQLCMEVDPLRDARLEVCREEPGLALPVLDLVALGLGVVRELGYLLLARLELLRLLLELPGLSPTDSLQMSRFGLNVKEDQQGILSKDAQRDHTPYASPPRK